MPTWLTEAAELLTLAYPVVGALHCHGTRDLRMPWLPLQAETAIKAASDLEKQVAGLTQERVSSQLALPAVPPMVRSCGETCCSVPWAPGGVDRKLKGWGRDSAWISTRPELAYLNQVVQILQATTLFPRRPACLLRCPPRMRRSGRAGRQQMCSPHHWRRQVQHCITHMRAN
jgi:hypothetical protein